MKLFFRNGKIERAPSHETCIQWEIKVGYHKLVSHRKREDGEWLWIADHAVKAGVFKCLAIVGIRMDQISTMNDLTLSLNDVTALAIVPMKVSNGTTVQDEFNKLAKRTGVPKAILIDHGSDLKCGTREFCLQNPGVAWFYDIVHKLANELLKRFGDNPRWESFTFCAAQAKKKLHLTKDTLQAPPNQRSKARWLNIDVIIDWAIKRYEDWDNGLTKTPEQLNWMLEFRSEVELWNQYVLVARETRNIVRVNGYDFHTSEILEHSLLKLDTRDPGVESFACDMIDFVKKESTQLKGPEKLIGSSEVVESAFGWFKYLLGETHWSKSGFGRLILALASRLGGFKADTIHQALNSVKIADVSNWLEASFAM